MNFIVRMRCVVHKNVYCDDCTKEEATQNPWDHAVGEDEVIQEDWEVLFVEENK